MFIHSQSIQHIPVNTLIYFMFPLSEHDDRTGPHYRSRKGRGSHRARYNDGSRRDRQKGGHAGGFGGAGPRSRLEDNDGDVTMADSPHDSGSQRRL